jgi:hypothetical protein
MISTNRDGRRPTDDNDEPKGTFLFGEVREEVMDLVG